ASYAVLHPGIMVEVVHYRQCECDNVPVALARTAPPISTPLSIAMTCGRTEAMMPLPADDFMLPPSEPVIGCRGEAVLDHHAAVRSRHVDGGLHIHSVVEQINQNL